MWYIILAIGAMALSLAAAKKGRKRRFNLRLVRLTPKITLSTLADETVLTGGVTGAADGQYRAMSFDLTWSKEGSAAGEGPITVGFAHSDYTVAEIKEALQAATAISLGDLVGQEKSNRLIRIVGTFQGNQVSGGDEVLNDGKPIHTKLNWAIPIGKFVNLFAFNQSGAALTTGQVVQTAGKMWVKDY